MAIEGNETLTMNQKSTLRICARRLARRPVRLVGLLALVSIIVVGDLIAMRAVPVQTSGAKQTQTRSQFSISLPPHEIDRLVD